MDAKYDDMVPVSLFANQELLDRHNDRLAVFDAGAEVTQMQQIVRAVNTFDQAREALDGLLSILATYRKTTGVMDGGALKGWEQKGREALAAMKGQP